MMCMNLTMKTRCEEGKRRNELRVWMLKEIEIPELPSDISSVGGSAARYADVMGLRPISARFVFLTLRSFL